MLRFFSAQTVLVPSIVGLSVEDALARVCHVGLHLHLLSTKEENSAVQGLVIEQIPHEGVQVKKQQVVYCVIAQPAARQKMPYFIHDEIEKAVSWLKDAAIRYKVHYVQSDCPANTCIAHYPEADTGIQPEEPVILYCAVPYHDLVLCPHFVGWPLKYVSDYLDAYHVRYEDVGSDGNSEQDPVVVEQRPLAGSLLESGPSMTISLRCQ